MSKNTAIKTILSDALKENKYQELSHDLILRNDTSGTSYFEYKNIKINELRDDSICISLPKNICQKGHNLTLVIFEVTPTQKISKLPTPEDKGSITVLGKVIDLFENGKNKVLIEIKFTQYKIDEWQRIVESYTGKQSSISSFIEEVKK